MFYDEAPHRATPFAGRFDAADDMDMDSYLVLKSGARGRPAEAGLLVDETELQELELNRAFVALTSPDTLTGEPANWLP